MKKQLLISGVLLLAAIAGILFVVLTTTPDRIGPVGITVFFFLVFAVFFIVFDFLWRLATKTRRQPKYNMYFIAVLAGIPTMLLALQSLRQLQLRDVLIVILLAVVIIFYLSKRKDVA